jgi:alkanesulfonate monooxygenase SsuD/methylene tetrahydromethanopterin reductase-like flavin-dependent oxidoreductase (luciferase family)
MHYGVTTPNWGDYGDPRLLAELAHEAEVAGWEGFFIWDHIKWPAQDPTADPWVALAAMAMRTERIRLGTMVTPLPRRRPWKLARETVTLDHLSGGRLILGVGSGYFQQEEFEAFGEAGDPKVRAAKLDEGLEVLTGLWSGEPFSYAGTQYQVKNVCFTPPVQRPRIPIWVAGTWPIKAPFRRAARWDGVVPIPRDVIANPNLTPKEIRDIVAYIKEHRTRAEPFDITSGGQTQGGGAAEDVTIVAPYAEAGATWWLEYIIPWRSSLAEVRERIRKGPPRV